MEHTCYNAEACANTSAISGSNHACDSDGDDDDDDDDDIDNDDDEDALLFFVFVSQTS